MSEVNYIGDSVWWNNEIDTKSFIEVNGPVLLNQECHRLRSGQEIVFGPDGVLHVTDPTNWSVVLDVPFNCDGLIIRNAKIDWINLSTDEPVSNEPEGCYGHPHFAYAFRCWPGAKNILIENLVVTRSVWGIVLDGVENITVNGFVAQPLARGIVIKAQCQNVAFNQVNLAHPWCPEGLAKEWQAAHGVGVACSPQAQNVTWDGSSVIQGNVRFPDAGYWKNVDRLQGN